MRASQQQCMRSMPNCLHGSQSIYRSQLPFRYTAKRRKRNSKPSSGYRTSLPHIQKPLSSSFVFVFLIWTIVDDVSNQKWGPVATVWSIYYARGTRELPCLSSRGRPIWTQVLKRAKLERERSSTRPKRNRRRIERLNSMPNRSRQCHTSKKFPSYSKYAFRSYQVEMPLLWSHRITDWQ